MGGPPSALASGLRSVAVAGDVTNSVIVTGDRANVQVRVDGADALLAKLLNEAQLPRKTPRPRPLDAFPPASREHLNRATETEALVAGVESGGPVRVSGEADIGKTMTLRHALAGDLARAVGDGVVYVFAKGKPYGDLLQDIFDAFFECEPPYLAREQQIRRDLRDAQALVVLDSVELSRDELGQLVMAIPDCRFIVISRESALGEGTPLRISGLSTADGLSLVEQELGRALARAERPQAEAVCNSLGGHPFKIRQAAAGVREGERSFDLLAQELAKDEAGSTLAQLVLASLTEEELAVVRQLAALRGETIGVEHTVALLGRETLAGRLGDLQRRRVIAAASPRYRIAGALNDLAESAPDSGAKPTGWPGPLDAERDRALAYFTRWAQAHRSQPALVLAEAPALLQLLRDAESSGRTRELIGLGRAIDAAFAWGRRWEVWGALLTTVLDAAHTSGDLGAQAWARHQLGTRAYCLGDVPQAIGLLQQARDIREQIDDQAGAAATRHNLEFIAGPGDGEDGDNGTDDNGGRSGPRRSLLVLGAVAAIVAVVAVATLANGGDGPRLNTGGKNPTVTGGGSPSTLSVDLSGDGTVTSRPAGIDCPGSCKKSFPVGSRVMLSARAEKGSRFDGWSGDCSGRGTCSLSVEKGTSVTATFTARSAPTQCEDGSDNDHDGLVDRPADPGCRADDTEAPATRHSEPPIPTKPGRSGTNTTTSPPIPKPLQPQPDLVIDKMYIRASAGPAAIRGTAGWRIFADIRNAGKASAPASVTEITPLGLDPLTVDTQALAPAATTTVSVDCLPYGTRAEATAVVDATKLVAESNEANNIDATGSGWGTNGSCRYR